jgi:hypothetical protein
MAGCSLIEFFRQVIKFEEALSPDRLDNVAKGELHAIVRRDQDTLRPSPCIA